MKTLKLFSVAMFAMIFGITTTMAQSDTGTSPVKTETFKVWGNCGMCKTRIEKAVKEDGATSADWDVKTKMLTVIFDHSKLSVDGLSKKLATVGHDTEKYRSEDKTYDALPACCKYERPVKKQASGK
jgi:periplasmic mercuric ion binding protein